MKVQPLIPASGDRLLIHLTPVEQPDDALGLIGLLLIVRDHHDGRLVFLIERLEDPHHLVAHLRVEVAGRLVGEQDPRPADNRPGDGDALLLAAGQLRRKVMNPGAEPDPVERRLGEPAPLGVRDAAIEQRDLHVVEHAQVADQVEGLEDEADLLVADRGQRPDRDSSRSATR